PKPDQLKDYLSPRKNAPVLQWTAIDLWSRTSPVPEIDPDPSLYLHGPDSGAGDVEIVWRADLDDASDEMQREDLWKERLSVCPPSSLESISVPIAEARRWLSGQATGDLGDVEGEEEPARDSGTSSFRAVLRWYGKEDERTKWISSSELCPGDVIVVAAARGG